MLEVAHAGDQEEDLDWGMMEIELIRDHIAMQP